MEGNVSPFEKPRVNPETELSHLRARVESLERATGAPREAAAEQVAAAYKKSARAQNEPLPPSPRAEAIVLRLAPEAHDKKMEELLGLLQVEGVTRTLDVVERLNDPHVSDDFHRLLVQYLVSAGSIQGLKGDSALFRAIDMKLYRLRLPRADTATPDALKKFIASMEGLYAALLSIASGARVVPGDNYFTFEMAVPDGTDEIMFFASVPRHAGPLFEQQFSALYPGARFEEWTNDYNIFIEDGGSVASVAESSVSDILPIKTYDGFEHDPMEGLLAALAGAVKEGEGVALQFVVAPSGDRFLKDYTTVLNEVKKGKPLEEALPPKRFLARAIRITDSLIFKKKEPKEGEEKKETIVDTAVADLIAKKLSRTIVATNVRVLSSARTLARAKELMAGITGAMSQVAEPRGNALLFELREGRAAAKVFKEFSYRLFNDDETLPLNLSELATVMHIPGSSVSAASVSEAPGITAPAPVTLAAAGTLLGVNRHNGKETKVFVAPEDRLRHFYVVGQTGTGKTTLLKQMAIQDIRDGKGVCFIDPHGSDILDILANFPKERSADLIYFDPGETERPLGLNMLEYDRAYPEQKTLVVNELLGIFNKLFDMKTAGGPAFEQYFRNSALLVMDDPESGNTLLDISRVLSDRVYRELKLAKCTNPLVIQFWQNALKTTGDQALANYVQYITNKFDVFLSNDIMRPVVAQERSAFNLREVMDSGKVLLVNLSKGRLGDLNAHLIGLILVGKLQMAALSRADGRSTMRDFNLYIDEFQNVTTDSIASILSEARKYRLSLTVAHQYLGQLPENIRTAVFGNVGSVVAFRVGREDAEFLEKQFLPTFTAADIMRLENWNAYAKLLVHGTPERPFSFTLLPPEPGDRSQIDALKRETMARYGRPRAEVEAAIAAKYQK